MIIEVVVQDAVRAGDEQCAGPGWRRAAIATAAAAAGGEERAEANGEQGGSAAHRISVPSVFVW